jgi:tetratricopeptide (TPR) repeat protein
MTGYSASIACILRCDSGAGTAPAGTGIVLDKCRVLTCAHVINEALGLQTFNAEAPSRKISLTIPWCQSGSTTFEAYVVNDLWVPPSEAPEFGKPEDLAVLVLTGDAVFPEDTASALLVDLNLQDEQDRRVWLTGFPGTAGSDRIDGLTRGLTSEGRIQIDPTLHKRVAAGGFSGAGIWDERYDGIIGMLIAKRKRDRATIAYGLPVNVIAKALGLDTIKPDEYPSLFLAPPRPYGYKLVGRGKIVQNLKTRLFSGRDSAICALNGLPGVGKTALAIELAHDPEVRAHFKDGVLWTGLGRDNPDILSRLAKWGIDLAIPPEQRANLTGDKEWAEAIRKAIGLRRMLLIIDDAWQVTAALSFRIGGDNCAHLLTTRSPKIAEKFAGKTTNIPELSDDNGLQLLAQFIPKIVKTDLDTIQTLERDVGGLPLALVLIGKFLKTEARSGQPSRISAAIKTVQSAKERLQLTDDQDLLTSHPSLPPGASISLQLIIDITVETLNKLNDKISPAFWSMSVFPPKPNTFSEEAACAVSETLPETLNTLDDYGLLESSGAGRYTLHQTIEEYAKMHLTGTAAYERMSEFFSNMLTPYGKPYVAFDRGTLINLSRDEENIEASIVWYEQQRMWDKFIPLVLGFCSYLGYISRWQEEIEWGKRAGDAANKIGDNVAKAHVYCHVLPWPMWMRGEYEEARESCRIGIEAARMLSNLDQAIYLSLAYHNLYRTALQECQNTSDSDLSASCLEESRLYSEKCLEYAMQTNKSSLFEALQGLAFSDMGYTALKVGDYQDAEQWFGKRLELVRQTNNQVQIACRLLDVSLSLIGQGKYPEAESCLKEAQTIAADWKRADLTAELMFGLAKIKRETGDVTHAEGLEAKAMKVWDELGFRREPFVFILNKPVAIGNE